MAGVRTLVRGVVLVVIMIVTFAAGWIVAKSGIGAAMEPASLTASERQFSERMKDASLVGSFTIDGREDRAASPDRYDVAGVAKVGDDRWRFDVRMRRGGVALTVPVAVPMRWVGDTPMIVMTNYSIPTLGTFSVRLFFYGDRYAGTWQNGKYGGHMFGRIEKLRN